MQRYIGIDAHSQSCTVAIMGPSGKRLREATVETNGKELSDLMRSIAGHKYVCVEEGTQAEWLHEILEPLVDELVVTLPAPIHGNKSDSADAWRLADRLRQGHLERLVFKAPTRFTGLRAAVKTYVVTQRDMVRAKTRLHALYRSRAIGKLNSEIYDPELRCAWLARLPAAQRYRAELLCLQLDGLVEAHKLAEQWLQQESDKVPLVRQLQTAPGIGKTRAALIVAIVISPFRFRTRRQFWSYCGLGIVTRSSADYVKEANGRWTRRVMPQTRGLNRNRHPLLKNVFKGAALTVVHQMPEHPLTRAFHRATLAGTKPNLAELTVARRIAAAVLAMWKNKEKYDPTKQ
jgi:transposase